MTDVMQYMGMMGGVGLLQGHLDAVEAENAELRARCERASEYIETLYTALDTLNTHHSTDHHHDDPAMPISLPVAEGYFAYREWKALEQAVGSSGGGDE